MNEIDNRENCPVDNPRNYPKPKHSAVDNAHSDLRGGRDLLFFGATFLSSWLIARPAFFLLYWGVCAWLTLTAVLLALFDMRCIRARALETNKCLRREVFREEGNE